MTVTVPYIFEFQHTIMGFFKQLRTLACNFNCLLLAIHALVSSSRRLASCKDVLSPNVLRPPCHLRQSCIQPSSTLTPMGSSPAMPPMPTRNRLTATPLAPMTPSRSARSLLWPLTVLMPSERPEHDFPVLDVEKTRIDRVDGARP